MQWEGTKQRQAQTDKWMRIACVLLALLFILQGLLVMIGNLPQDRYLGDTFYFLLVAITTSLVVLCMGITRSRMRPGVALLRAVGLELIAIGFIMTSTGFGSLLSLALILILYESYLSYKLKGLAVTATILTVAIAYDTYRAMELGLQNTADTLVVVFAMFAITLVAAAILHIQTVRQATLAKSHAQVKLERDRIATLINNLTQGVIGIDAHGVIRTYNAAALNLLEAHGSLKGKQIDKVLHVYDAQKTRLSVYDMARHTTQAEVRDDIYYRYGDDVARFEVTVTPVTSNKQSDQSFIILLRDVTKQKNLDDERDEFISVVSHELRTPLTIAEGTLGNVEALYDKGISSSERIRPALATAHEQIKYLSGIVNDLGTLARAEQGDVDMEPTNIHELLTEVYKEHLPVAKKSGIKLDIDAPHNTGTVRTNSLYLTEILGNLLTNAIRYTPEGTVKLTAHQDKGTITVSVIDTGIGIAKSDQAKIFDKFYRSEDYRTRETRGTGLGLYVASKLAAKLGTSITVKSRLNHGSSFSLGFTIADDE